MNPQTEHVQCNYCSSTKRTLLFPDFDLAPAGDRGVVRCSECGQVYRDIRLTAEAMMEVYAAWEYPDLGRDWIEGRKNVFRPYVAMLDSFRQTGRVLDVGAGFGFFLAACREAGWSPDGIEPSGQCRQFAESELGIGLSSELLESGVFEPNTFDLVTFWNVLSQVADPRQTLRHARDLLRPGGAVVIRSPNAAFHIGMRKTLNAMGRIVPPIRTLDQTVFHLYVFDVRTITRLLGDVGFAECRVAPAELSWTTAHDAASNRIKRLVVQVVEGMARGVYALTAGRYLYSSSMLTTGIKIE